ncbi:hypothetical protein HYH03_012758 [Edaphochlamys debaryana]|uniref:Arsenite methyltransferase n=1 Tax=Edaphochlamys debaryana TaxID=47281 RepID=A0A835XSA4_9CHLO|nr:hypothetical protein HYH03_012758 [Edaphochlamys debaryana]|eukprot:KAG2488760.1 hypothetical protein HYH03_012758 [Edaphochlamys debaryana]
MSTAAPVEPAALAELTAAHQLGTDQQAVKDSVKTYYGETLKNSGDLRTSACTACKAPPPAIRAAIAAVPAEVKDRFYGCGNPIPAGISGLRVLDLGCGSGRDCYVAARMVGDKGSVIGVDMTPSQLEVARGHAESYCRETLGYAQPNMRFVQGEIEYLDRAGIEDASVDLIISNCVINLSPDKARVLSEAYRVLAPGGEMHFSDVYCDRRLPQSVRTHPVLLGECLAGALYINDFIRLCRKVGFTDPRQLESTEITINDQELKDLVGEARFFSITYRLFKVPGQIEDLCEDYGQVAVYTGTIPGHPHAYDLDDHHRFVTNKPMLVCGNTASMVGETWLGSYFTVIGDRAVHFGQFDCGPSPAGGAASPAPSGGACGPAGSGTEYVYLAARGLDGSSYAWLEVASGRDVSQQLRVVTGDTVIATLRSRPGAAPDPPENMKGRRRLGRLRHRRLTQFDNTTAGASTTSSVGAGDSSESPFQLLGLKVVATAISTIRVPPPRPPPPAPPSDGLSTLDAPSVALDTSSGGTIGLSPAGPLRLRSFTVPITMCGWGPSTSVQGLQQRYFRSLSGGEANLEDHHQTCSYGKVAFSTDTNVVLSPVEVSCNGSVRITSTLSLPYDSAAKCNSVEQSVWRVAVENAIRAAGYGDVLDGNTGTRVLVVLPLEANCTWAGFSQIGCNSRTCPAYIHGSAAHDVDVLFHEMGHLWGLSHAAFGSDPYGDQTDPMGSAGTDPVKGGYMCFNGGNYYKLGWGNPIQVLNQSQTYSPRGLNLTIHSTAITDTNYLFLNYSRPGFAYPNYFITMRTRNVAFDASLLDTYVDKVHITQFNGSQSVTDYFRPVLITWLAAGQSWRSTFRDAGGDLTRGGGITVTVLEIRPGARADVNVCFFVVLNESGDRCRNGYDDDCDAAAAGAAEPAFATAALATPAAATAAASQPAASQATEPHASSAPALPFPASASVTTSTVAFPQAALPAASVPRAPVAPAACAPAALAPPTLPAPALAPTALTGASLTLSAGAAPTLSHTAHAPATLASTPHAPATLAPTALTPTTFAPTPLAWSP